jgi:hypothetical protein
MGPSAIFGPFFAMIALTFIVWIYMYSKRIPFIRRTKPTPEQLTPTEFARISPPDVSNPSDNLKNLFELPTVFYALLLYLFVTNQVDSVYLAAAWAFVGLRVLHSLIHCTINAAIVRFAVYAAASIALWFIAARAMLGLI